MTKYKSDEYRAKHAAYAREWRKKQANKKSNGEAQKRYKERNPSKYTAIQRSSGLKKLYGLSLVQRNAMFQAQGHRCAICTGTDSGRKDGTWALDHCHDTNAIRGILCHRCNAMLGYARDNPETLAAAIVYLAKHPKPARFDAPPAAIEQLTLFSGEVAA